MRYLSFPLFIMLLSGIAMGFGYYDSFNNGSPISGFTSATASLGGLRSQPASTAAGLFMNPGELGLLAGTVISVDGGSLRWTEAVHDTTYQLNRGGQILGTATAAAATGLGSFVFAAGAAKVADYDYEGTHNTVNAYSGDLELVEVAWVTGSQWEYLAGVSRRLLPGVSLGFSGGVRTTYAEFDYYFSDKTFGGIDSTAQWTIDENEFCWHAGLVTTSELARAGVSYSSGTGNYYRTIAFGGSVVSPHIANTRTGFEAEVVDPFDRNDFTGKLFIETPITVNFDMRTSVLFMEGYQTSRTSLGFGLGGGYTSGDNLELSVACLWKGRTRSDAFPNEQADRVDDSTISLVVGSVYRI